MYLTVNLALAVAALVLALVVGVGACVALCRWISWGDAVLAVLTFLLARNYVLGPLQSLAVTAVGGTAAQPVFSGLASAVMGALAMAMAFFFTLGFIYRGQPTLKLAVSTGVGALLAQLVLGVGYAALNYALVLNALRSGDAAQVFSSFDTEQAASMASFFENLAPTTLMVLVLQPLVAFVAYAGAALLFYRAYDHYEPVGMLRAFGWLLACELLGTFSQSFGPVAGIVGGVAAVVLGAWYLLAYDKGLVRDYVRELRG